MQEPRFGRLVRVSLEEMWNGNGREFLGWLARDENLAYLGELMDASLKLESMTEDKERKDPMLLCLDRDTNSRFVILSPVVRSDDAGLGKLSVYAARLRPVNMVVLAGNFHPSHLKALSWLNEATNQDLSIFGMKVEFWRIGNSALAPNFDLIVSPNYKPHRAVEPPDEPEITEDDVVIEVETGTLARLDSVFPSDFDEPSAPAEEPPLQPSNFSEPAQDLPQQAPPLNPDETGTEAPITPSGMRRMFTSRRFGETMTGNLPPEKEHSPPPALDDVDVEESATRETSPIGGTNGGESAEPGLAPDATANWDAVQPQNDQQDLHSDWSPDVNTTVTPSGMLHRIRAKEEDLEGQSGLGSPVGGDPPNEIYIEFWQQFLRDVIEFDGEAPSERSMGQGWISFPFNREYFSLVAFLNKTHGLAGIGLVIDGPQSNSLFQQLYQDKVQIEGELGDALDWRELPEKKESHIYLHRKNVNISNRANWTDYQNWFANALELFMGVFGNRIETLGSSIMWGD